MALWTNIYNFPPLNFRVRNVTLQMPESRQSQSLLLQQLRRPNETKTNSEVSLYRLPLSLFFALTQSLSLSVSHLPFNPLWITLTTFFCFCYYLEVKIWKKNDWEDKSKWTAVRKSGKVVELVVIWCDQRLLRYIYIFVHLDVLTSIAIWVWNIFYRHLMWPLSVLAI